MFTYLLISHESHFQFRVLPHVRSADNFTAHNKAYEIPDFVRFKAPVTGFDFCKRSHHYLTSIRRQILRCLHYSTFSVTSFKKRLKSY